jgi:hypothetical protein
VTRSTWGEGIGARSIFDEKLASLVEPIFQAFMVGEGFSPEVNQQECQAEVRARPRPLAGNLIGFLPAARQQTTAALLKFNPCCGLRTTPLPVDPAEPPAVPRLVCQPSGRGGRRGGRNVLPAAP